MCERSWNVAARLVRPGALRAPLIGAFSAFAAFANACGRPASVVIVAPAASDGRALSANDVALIAALLEAADTRRADTALIDRALASPSSFVRRYAARTVGQNAIVARSGVLLALVAADDTAVAADAAFALGLLRDTAGVPALARALGRSGTVADAAAWSLGELGNAGRPTIEQALTSGGSARTLESVLHAAAKLRPVPAALIAPYLEHRDADLNRGAAYAVTRSRVPASVRALLALETRLRGRAASPSPGDPTSADLRSYVARGLGQAVVGDSLRSDAMAALRRLIDDGHPHVRINAVRSLATYGAEAQGALLLRLRDSDTNVRVALAQSLGDVLGARAVEWAGAWGADTGLAYRRALLTAAARAGAHLAALDPASTDAWQRRSDWRYRAAAAQAAGAGTAADIDAIAVPLLRDPDPRVRNAAYGAALIWADSASSVAKPYGRLALPRALADPDLFVRASILDALRPRAGAADALVAFRAWRAARADPENDARLAALRVIATAWSRDSAGFSGALRDSLGSAGAPADPLELAVGRTIGPLRVWPLTASPSRSMAWYTDQVRSYVVPAVSGRPTLGTVVTSRGTIHMQFYGADAPLTVANFAALARKGYYNGLAFHRVVPNFVAQDGDPRGDGSGGPGYAIRDELNRRWYDRGTVGMALSGPDTGGSQYFLAHSPQPHLDGHYTVFGHVTQGLDVLDAIVQGDRIFSIAVR